MAISLVQSTNSSSGASSLAFGSNNTAGNLLVLIQWDLNNTGTSATVPTDTQGNTWNLAVNSSSHCMVFYAMNSKAGANTVTPHLNGSSYGYEIAEWSGVATSSALDIAHGVTGSGLFPYTSSATAVNGELVIAAESAAGSSAGGGSTPATITPQAGFTTDIQNFATWITPYPHARTATSAYEVQPSAGTITFNAWSVSGTDTPSIQDGVIVTFKPAPAAGGVPNSLMTMGCGG